MYNTEYTKRSGMYEFGSRTHNSASQTSGISLVSCQDVDFGTIYVPQMTLDELEAAVVLEGFREEMSVEGRSSSIKQWLV